MEAVRGAEDRQQAGDTPRHRRHAKGAKVKIAILANGIDHVASVQRCFVALLEHGHVLTFVDGNPVAAVQQMVEDGVDAILKLSDGDELHDEIAARFFRETGRPVWRGVTDIPLPKPN
jgi:hypothetical protein